MSDDHVMVQPVRTFLEGPDLKHPASEPYRVSRFHAQQLRANGLVVHVEEEPAPTAPASPEPAASAALVAADPAPPVAAAPEITRRRGRPPGKRL